MRNLVGITAKGFRFEDLLGIGGFAVTYRVFDETRQATVCLKLLAPHLCRDPKIVSLFVSEGEIARKLDHEGIVKVFDSGIFYGKPYHSIEYVDGETLRHLASRSLAPMRLLELLTQLASALDYLHEQGFIHCDVTPSNVVVGLDQKAKLLDFGISQRLFGHRLRENLTTGTPGYLAPEQAAGKRLSPKTDIYALARVAEAGLAAAPPLTSDVKAILAEGMHADPRKRPTRALDLVAKLRAALVQD